VFQAGVHAMFYGLMNQVIDQAAGALGHSGCRPEKSGSAERKDGIAHGIGEPPVAVKRSGLSHRRGGGKGRWDWRGRATSRGFAV